MGYGGPRRLLCYQRRLQAFYARKNYQVSQDADGNRALRMALQTRTTY
jgi:glycine cleavage system pyridoxal-binding protein P